MSALFEAKASAALQSLGLTVACAQLDSLAQQAAAHSWSYTDFLGRLLEGELCARLEKRVALNLQFAKFPYLKRLTEGRNVLLLGPPGVGKTHLAIGLGVRVAEMGHRVHFTSAMDLARKLTRAVDANRLHRELNALQQPKLLIIDEIGYLPFDAVQASLLFQVICRRYQRNQSLVLTSNKAFSDWGSVFADDPVMASAALDRLLHRSTIINIRGESYRLKEKRQAGPFLMRDPLSENGAGPHASADPGGSILNAR